MAMSWTRDDVIRHCAVCAATGNRIDLSGRDLTGVNLTGLNLRLADLREADLREADMREADLRVANLREADLREADMREANLRWADLREADMREANTDEADLTGAIGIVCLHVDDPRGYRPIAVERGAHWMSGSGCRWLTAADALAHWGEDDYHTPELGQAYCRAIRELPQK